MIVLPATSRRRLLQFDEAHWAAMAVVNDIKLGPQLKYSNGVRN
jgi:hypothetical protein